MAERKYTEDKGVEHPAFVHLEDVKKGYDHLFSLFQVPDSGLRQALFAGLLVENSVTLLSGTYGTGKTQFVNLVKKIFFSDGQGGYSFDYETCHQELTAFDVLYHLDLADLQAGKEMVHPKKMISARLKFLNEIQRANTGFFNALLPLMSEHRITYRDFEFDVPDFIMIMDRNPLDTGSSTVPEAFLDRVDFGFDIPAVYLEDMMKIRDIRRQADGFHWGELHELADSMLTFDQLKAVWRDVKRVDIPYRATLVAGMVSDAMRLCIMAERSNARFEFDLDCPNCQFHGEICSHLIKVPGMRVTNSMLRLAQALAWFDGRTEVVDQDIMATLPWCLSHRLSLRPEELRKKPCEQIWVRETAISELLRPKLPFWNRAIDAFINEDATVLEEMGENDLVVRELQVMLESRGLA